MERYRTRIRKQSRIAHEENWNSIGHEENWKSIRQESWNGLGHEGDSGNGLRHEEDSWNGLGHEGDSSNGLGHEGGNYNGLGYGRESWNGLGHNEGYPKRTRTRSGQLERTQIRRGQLERKKNFSKFRKNVTFFVTKAAPAIYARIMAVLVLIDRPMNVKVISGVHWFSSFVPWRVWERSTKLKTGKKYRKTRFWHISKIISHLLTNRSCPPLMRLIADKST